MSELPPAPAPAPLRARAALVRAVAAAGMALCFVLVAMFIEPRASRASERGVEVALPDGVSRDIPAVFYEVDSTSDLGRSLGALHGRRHLIEIVGGRNGAPVTFRVLDADGRVVADGLLDEDVSSVDRDLTVDRMGDYPEGTPTLRGPLMLLTPRGE